MFGSSSASGLWQIPASGGVPMEITSLDRGHVNHAWPHILPGGRAVLFTILIDGPIDNAQVAVLDLDTGEHEVLVSGGSAPRYSSTGHIVYGPAGARELIRPDPAPRQTPTSVSLRPGAAPAIRSR